MHSANSSDSVPELIKDKDPRGNTLPGQVVVKWK